MNDDLKLLITYISRQDKLIKVVLVVEHGMNIERWRRVRKEADSEGVKKLILNYLPLYVRNHIDEIVNVEDLFSVSTLEYTE